MDVVVQKTRVAGLQPCQAVVALTRARRPSGGRGMESWTFHNTPNTPPATLLRRLHWFYFQDYLFRISQFTPLATPPSPSPHRLRRSIKT